MKVVRLVWASALGRALWGLGAAAGLGLFATLALVVTAASLRLPGELGEGIAAPESTRYVDAGGRPLREVRASDATRAAWASYDSLGDDVVHALLAAEDRRFMAHRGVDPWAVVRAAASDVARGRVVSGASTLTMQLARLLRPHPRNLAGKFLEAALALRIEASLGKRAIVEQYANRAPFGAGLRGLDAASRFWFDKPPRDLSLAEAATLAAIPRGPAVYSIDKHPDRVLKRRDRVLDRMRAAGWISPERWALAQSEPLVARAGKGGAGAPHLVQELALGRAGLWPAELGAAPALAGAERVETTLEGDLQREVELATKAELAQLVSRHVTNAAVVVLDNATADILAYVGSADFSDDAHCGQNDGVLARRQPGSTLKPFVYGLGMERLGWTAATMLPDVELRFASAEGTYAPMNYDERFHGPVRLREALGNSLNVVAVWATDQMGVSPVLQRLCALGFSTLAQDDSWYGPGIALGDGEVTLLDLAAAYSTLARGGVYRTPRAVRRVVTRAGSRDMPLGGERRVMPREVALVLADVLADPRARAAAFGEASVLDLPFQVAAKTGTSKGFRDNWTVGFTHEVTVAVWVGNFDGSPMRGTSGITGAGPLFHTAIEAAMRGKAANPLLLSSEAAREEGLVEAEVCPLSGGRPTHACPNAVREWMPVTAQRELKPCALHESFAVDRRNGLRAGPGCPAAFVAQRTFERYEGALRTWAASTRRPIAPLDDSPLCGATAQRPSAPDTPSAVLRIGWPTPGTRFVIDPGRAAAQQQLRVRIDADAAVRRVRLFVDGRAAGEIGPPFVALWPLAQGEHVLTAVAEGGARSEPVAISVE
jgi:penicillin-binding protein 1C